VLEGKCFIMSRTHKTHPEAEKNLHISLVDKILQIGHHQSPNDKSRILFRNLTCLWTDTDHPEVLQIKQGNPYGCDGGGFIAVSYSFEHTPGLECDRNGRYIIVGPSGGYIRRSKVRDVTLRTSFVTRNTKMCAGSRSTRNAVPRRNRVRNRPPWIPWMFCIVEASSPSDF
jgi:hypothetical protein